MKSVQWVLIGCRVMSVCLGLTLLNSGCGDQSAAPGGVSSAGGEEERRRHPQGHGGRVEGRQQEVTVRAGWRSGLLRGAAPPESDVLHSSYLSKNFGLIALKLSRPPMSASYSSANGLSTTPSR